MATQSGTIFLSEIPSEIAEVFFRKTEQIIYYRSQIYFIINLSKFFKSGRRNIHLEHIFSVGENLAWSWTSQDLSDDQIAGMLSYAYQQAHFNWYDEVEYYNYETGQSTDSSKAVGHFTQVRYFPDFSTAAVRYDSYLPSRVSNSDP